MSQLWIIVLVAIAGGAAIASQAQLTGLISDRLGTLEAVALTYIAGGLLAAAVLAVAGGGAIGAVRELPPMVHLAGPLGLVIIATISFSVGRLGVVRGLLLITVAQFVLAAIIDHFGWLGADVQPLTMVKGAGIVLLLGGAWLVLR